jgi:hypothetical protein
MVGPSTRDKTASSRPPPFIEKRRSTNVQPIAAEPLRLHNSVSCRQIEHEFVEIWQDWPKCGSRQGPCSSDIFA